MSHSFFPVFIQLIYSIQYVKIDTISTTNNSTYKQGHKNNSAFLSPNLFPFRIIKKSEIITVKNIVKTLVFQEK